ncbi:uncharacterized protein LOC135075693 [Ostrinia nubilalis]|uniref:uncharacterized protein LOC135075693 n=1 Tax=Ostrinia nubilalis TaxID=29057 RepID=UPI003082295B
MSRSGFCYAFILISLIQYVSAHQKGYAELCKDKKTQSLSCSTQLADQQRTERDVCTVEHFSSESPECKNMDFGPIKPNGNIGGVSLKPYILTQYTSFNFTVLNITFTNIKWKEMKFRFQPTTFQNRHCRNIVLSNDVTIDDRSILYYDCYWSHTDGDYNNTSHILDFEATSDKSVSRGQYYFNIPNMQMLSPFISENEWKPFLYIEILPSDLRLHIMPPPAQLQILGYKIEVRKGCMKGTPVSDCSDELVKQTTLTLKNNTQEVTYNYYFLGQTGYYYFVVTPLHSQCSYSENKCTVVASPKIAITHEQKTLNICIASVTALVVATLFGYYIALRFIRRFWCKDYKMALDNEIPAPTKVLVIYSPASRLHAECVATFVAYLKSEYGFDVMFDGDIAATSHGDPYIWAEEAIQLSTHVLYIVGPAEEKNLYNNIYEKPIGAHKDVDVLLLSMVKAFKTSRCPKDVSNVFFEYSTGTVPIETKHGKVFFLLKDWQKLISHLSKNLLPKKTIMRTEKGRCFLDELTKAKKMLGGKCDNVGKSLV